MALEYDFYAAADITREEFLTFLAQTMSAPISHDYVRGDGLQATAHRETPEEEASTVNEFGFPERISATFRFANLASEQLTDQNTVLMIRTVLAFFDRYPGSGVLLFNGERVVLQKLDGDVELDSDWEDFSLDGMAEVIAGLSQRPLPQPFL